MRQILLFISVLVLTANCYGQTEQLADGSLSWRQYLSAYSPYDGTGRYTMDQDDGVRGIQGLTELAGRFGAKPYRDLQPLPYDGTWQTERVVFCDLATGAMIVRLTNDPWADSLSYFKGNWSADGQYIVFRRQPGMWEGSTATHGPMAVRSDGTGLHNVFREYRTVRSEVCSPTESNICYAMVDGGKLVAFDLKTGGIHHVVRDVRGFWHLKISPDGQYLMGRCLEKEHRVLWIVSSDGREYHEIPVPESIHDSYQFHPSQKKIMFWYEDRVLKEGFVQCDFDGHNMTKVPIQFDWNHGDVGLDRGVHTEGYITRIEENNWLSKEPLFHLPGVKYYDNPANYNGYAAWQPKDQFRVYATRILASPYLSELQCFFADPIPADVVNRYRICYTGLKRGNALDNPDASPDGTKVLFNSNMLDRVDVYYVVAKLPEPPRDLKAKRASYGVKLTWNAPSHHAEIAGYYVYRSNQSGMNYIPITKNTIPALEFIDRAAPNGAVTFYAVSAVEHSGLESGLSTEIALENNSKTKRHLFVEAEQAQCQPMMWLGFQGSASSLCYLWMRGKGGEGCADLNLELPEINDSCDIWARIKGEQGVQFTLKLEDKLTSLSAAPTAQWVWKKFDKTITMKPGKCAIRLASTTYGSAIDCIIFTNDPQFSPAESPRVKWPSLSQVEDVKAKADSPYTVKLTWKNTESSTWHHYNLYCAHSPNFTPDQTTLIASPDRNTYYDWGLKPGKSVFYRVTSVDRAGNESPPSATVKVILPPVELQAVELNPSESIDFQILKSDTYVLWLKLKKSPESGQYINFKIDDAKTSTWTCVFDGLSEESWFTYDQWGRFNLLTGSHKLYIDNKTKYVIEKILLTNDLSYRPIGHVNILSGW